MIYRKKKILDYLQNLPIGAIISVLVTCETTEMKYEVLDIFPLESNTSVTIAGNGVGLRNNMQIFDANGNEHRLLSVAMVNGQDTGTTTLLVAGEFKSDILVN